MRALRSQFVKDVVSWPRRLVGSQSGTRIKRRSRSIRATSRALRSISQEDEVSLALKESRADFPEVSLQHLDPSEWKLAAYGAFFRDEGIMILEARCILCAVWYAESCYPLGRLPILSDNLALVLALCKRRSTFFTLLSVMRRIIASGFWEGFVLSLLGGCRQN